MIPVSHLARDGFTPIAMGMVLCNDADVTPYVNMVQGLHVEGVVRDSASRISYMLMLVKRHSISPIPLAYHSSSFPPSSTRPTPYKDSA